MGEEALLIKASLGVWVYPNVVRATCLWWKIPTPVLPGSGDEGLISAKQWSSTPLSF